MEKETKDKAQEFYEKSRANSEILKEIDNLAMLSFGIAISPFFVWWIYLIPVINIIIGIISFFLFIASIVFGFMSLSRISNDDKLRGKGFALTGVILSLIYILILTISVIFISSFI